MPHDEEVDLYATRLSKPPDVVTSTKAGKRRAPITTPISKITKPKPTVAAQKKRRIIVPESPDMMEEEDMLNDPTLLTQPYTAPTAPVISHAKPTTQATETNHPKNDETTSENAVKKKRAIVPISDKINYDITADVLNKKADIDIKDLLIAVPGLKRELLKCIRTQTTIREKPLTLAFAEDGDVDTTAVYTDVYIGDIKIRCIIDTGSAKTVMSKHVAKLLNLDIDAPSTAVFTLGNGTKQAALGLIYDVPINIGGKLIIPFTVEVLPECPTNIIIGNNWLCRAKATISLENKTLKVNYKGTSARIDFDYIKSEEINNFHITSQNRHYEEEKTNTLPVIQAVPKMTKPSIEDTDDDSSIDDLVDDESVMTDELMPDSSEEEDDDALMVLEDTYQEKENSKEHDELVLIQKTTNDPSAIDIVCGSAFYLPPHTKKDFVLYLGDLKLEDYSNFTQCLWSINSEKLFNPSTYHQLITSNIKQDGTLLMVSINNSSLETVEFEKGEPLFETELLYDYEIDAMDCYDLCKIKPPSELLLATATIESASIDNHANAPLDYETKVKEKIDISTVPDNIKSEFLELICQYDHLFDWDNNKIGNIDVFEHEIKLKPDAVPKRVRPYRLSPKETESLRVELDKLLRLGIIEKGGYSDWASPIIMLKKKDGTYRIVADFRYLNSQSEIMNYPLNNIDELLDTLNKAYWMSTFDLRSGFFQANISEASQPLTTVVCPLGDYYFKKLPMGIKTSPSIFSKMMEQCFHNLIYKSVILYLDDVTSYTNTKDPRNHLEDLAQVFDCMDKHGIILNPKKCHFFKEEILFLGYIVSRDHIKPNPATVEKVKNFPLPTTLKQVRSFLGLSSYYRRFVPNFAKIARPLHNQLKTTKKVYWTQEATKAFEILKDKLTSYPVLWKPDFNRPYFVVTDASIEGLGAILTQKDDDGHEHPIIYSSRSLQGAEVNYGISKLELLAVVWAIQLYRPYLHGSKFTVTVISDHSALNGLLKTAQPTGILARWLEILSDYDFKIVYRPGRINESADYLSRLGY